VGAALRSRRRQRGFIVNPYVSAPVDPNFSSVVLLLHFDGADGATSAADHSSYGRTLTFGGTARLSTTSPKFGSACLLLDGAAGDRVTIPNFAEFCFGSSDFAVEAWINPDTVSGIDTIITNRSSSGTDNNWLFRLDSGLLRFVAWGPTTGTVLVDMTGVTTISTGVYTHVAATRSGSNWYLWVGGSQDATTTNAGAIFDSTSSPSNTLYIGEDPSQPSRLFDGRIDDLRLTKGVARYTAGFTPPTAPFPNQ
jgi:hypothetical protein